MGGGVVARVTVGCCCGRAIVFSRHTLRHTVAKGEHHTDVTPTQCNTATTKCVINMKPSCGGDAIWRTTRVALHAYGRMFWKKTIRIRERKHTRAYSTLRDLINFFPKFSSKKTILLLCWQATKEVAGIRIRSSIRNR